MAGLGRRTHYRKHLTDSVLNDLPEPQQNERIAKVVATRGGNHFDILVAEKGEDSKTETATNGNNETNLDRIPQLAILPTKFHKLVWVKRNDFVIVQTGTNDEEGDVDDDNNGDEGPSEKDKQEPETSKKTCVKEDTGGIRFIISHILYKDQIKHLQAKGLWPNSDPEFHKTISDGNTGDTALATATTTTPKKEEADDGIVYADDYGYDSEDGENMDDMLFVNTNRVAALTIQDDDEGDSSDEDD